LFRLLLQPLILLKHLITLCDELLLNIRTISPPSLARGEQEGKSVLEDNEEYSTINYWFIRKIVRIARPGDDDIFYDLGCGMGRVLCMFARRRLKKCVGVEFSPYYYGECVKNASRLRQRKSPVDIRCGDAATADLSDGTIYYMFNPFGASTMKKVLENVEKSLIRNPRKVLFIYANPVHRHLLESCGWLCLHRTFNTVFNLTVTFWTNHAVDPS
jgi:SAM-dependent methyltransferase